MTAHAQVVLIAGSPALASRSAALLRNLGVRLSAHGISSRVFTLSDFSGDDVFHARVGSPSIVELLTAVQNAKAVVLGTPVYKAVYSGALKALVDLIAPDGLEHKTVVGIATGRLPAHGMSVTRAFDELFAFFKGALALPSLFLLDPQLTVRGDSIELASEAEAPFGELERSLIARLR